MQLINSSSHHFLISSIHHLLKSSLLTPSFTNRSHLQRLIVFFYCLATNSTHLRRFHTKRDCILVQNKLEYFSASRQKSIAAARLYRVAPNNQTSTYYHTRGLVRYQTSIFNKDTGKRLLSFVFFGCAKSLIDVQIKQRIKKRFFLTRRASSLVRNDSTIGTLSSNKCYAFAPFLFRSAWRTSVVSGML